MTTQPASTSKKMVEIVSEDSRPIEKALKEIKKLIKSNKEGFITLSEKI
jgi:ribosomal protein S21